MDNTQDKPKRLTNEEKIEILTLSNVKGLGVMAITREMGRSRPAVQKVLDNDQHLFAQSEITERIRDEILKNIEKHNMFVNDTSGMIMESLNKTVRNLTDKEYIHPSEVQVLLQIMDRIQKYQTKALENSEKINMNKHEISKTVDNSNDGLSELIGAIANFGKD